MLNGEERLAEANFIETVVEHFRHTYASELYRALSIFIFVDRILQIHPHIRRHVSIIIELDY